MVTLCYLFNKAIILYGQVMSRHSWKDQATQPKIKYFTQIKARPPTFVAFLSGKAQLPDSYIRFLTKSLTEDFNLGGIPIRIMQRSAPRKTARTNITRSLPPSKTNKKFKSDKRTCTAKLPSTWDMRKSAWDVRIQWLLCCVREEGGICLSGAARSIMPQQTSNCVHRQHPKGM